ncbi:MAG TPA: energy-coupling factor transporter transmembrane component T [Coriobacteriia bacterium]|nr:energy-coupling factor transporter transmembrane component T [Coriobacteriia bacterium]
MNIGRIDASATLGRSWLHRVSPVSKLLALTLVLAATIVTWNVLLLGSLALTLVAAAVSARLAGGLVATLIGYPAAFATIFAVSAATTPLGGVTIVLKAVTAALGAILLVLTTPYPFIFAPVQRVLPPLVGDALLMTYRSLFLLLEKFGNLLTAARLRAGLRGRHPVRSARAATHALGGLLIYSFDLAQRSYDIMRIRGYEGRLRVTVPRSASPRADGALIATAAGLLALSVTWRIEWQALNPYSWVLPFVPAAALVVALGSRWRKA